MDADAKLKEGKYEEALDKYMIAAEQSINADNIGSKYISDKLESVKNSIRVTDLLTLGDESEELGDIQGAENTYKQAKDLAIDLNLKDERKEAMDKLEKIMLRKRLSKIKRK